MRSNPLPPLPGFADDNSHAVNDRLGQIGGASFDDTSQVATVWQFPAGFTTG